MLSSWLKGDMEALKGNWDALKNEEIQIKTRYYIGCDFYLLELFLRSFTLKVTFRLWRWSWIT